MIIYDDNAYYAYLPIEQQRARLMRSSDSLQQTDYGSGGAPGADGSPAVITRRVADIARRHLESPKIGQLLFRLTNNMTAQLHRPLTILELGTSLGITTAYLASPAKTNRVLTCEGAPEIADEAMAVWRALGLENIELVEGNIDDTLKPSCPKRVDIAYIDANHTYEATIRYFHELLPAMQQHSILVVDDLYHSEQMTRAWNEIKTCRQVTSTIDCYDVGLVFFDKHYLRKNYKIRI